jgi:tRNA (guanine37-N1)-methyltransferase
MRHFGFISIHPKIIDAYRQFGVFKAAETKSIAKIVVQDLRDFAADKHGSVDAPPYGGGDGMVMRADCLKHALDHLRQEVLGGMRVRVIFTSPSGKLWTQKDAEILAQADESLIFVCGRFAGVDERFIEECVDDEYSVGDVVLAGGELPVLMISESILRLMPGVLGHERSAVDDSFGAGVDGLLEYPSYTRPPQWQGINVPEVLMSGNHEAIATWRREASIKKTRRRRPDLIK